MGMDMHEVAKLKREIESLRQQLANRPRIDEPMLKGATDTAAVIVNELRQQLAECEREKFGLETKLQVKGYQRQLDDLAEQLDTVTKERDELVKGVKISVPTDTMEQALATEYRRGYKAALAKVGADKGE